MQRSQGPSLWIIRHGRAESSSPSGHDTDRSLDEEGRQQALWLGETLAADAARPAVIVASPAVRTWTTAQTIAQVLGVAAARCPLLTCEHRLSHAIDTLNQTWGEHPDAHVALIGHNPTVSELLSWLVDGIGQPGVHLRTGEAVLLGLGGSVPLEQPGGAILEKFCRRG